jgi:hypothetical protein
MSRFENNLIFEAYIKKQIPLEESISVLLKNDVILSQEIYNEWDMKKAFSGGLSKGVSNIVSGAKDFLQDKVNKYIVKPLLAKVPGIIGEFAKCDSKECIGQVLARYRGDAEKIVGQVNSGSLQLASFDTSGFWDLILSEAAGKGLDEKLKNSILEVGNSLGDGGAEALLGIADENISLEEVEGNDNLKRLCGYVAKLVVDGDERVEGISKLASILKGVESKLSPSDSEFEGKYGPIINSIVTNKFFISNDEETIGKAILSAEKGESELSIVPKDQETQIDRVENNKPENTAEVSSIKRVKTSIDKIASTKGKARKESKNKLTSLYKGADRIAEIIKGHEEVAVGLAENPKKVKVQKAQSVANITSGNRTAKNGVRAVMATAVGISTGKLPALKNRTKSRKNKTAQTKNEKEFYQSVPELFRLLDFVARRYTPYIEDFIKVIKSVQPSINLLAIANKKELATKEVNNEESAIKALNDPNSDDSSIVNAFKVIHPKLKNKSDEEILKFVNQYSGLLKQMGEQKFKTKFLETLLKTGIDKKFHEAVYNLIKNKSGSSVDKQGNDIIEAEFVAPDAKDGQIVQSNDPSVSGKTPEQLKQEIINLIRKNVPDAELHDDVLRAFQSSEERIKKAKDAEERKRQLQELKLFLISKGFASEQNINHVMAAIAHMSKGGFVRPMGSDSRGQEEQQQQPSGSIKDKVNKIGKQSLFKILYDMISDKSQMLSLGTGMGILFICFLLFGPAFLGLLYLAAKAKQSEQGSDDEEQDQTSQQSSGQSGNKSEQKPSVMGGLKDAAKEAASNVRNTIGNAVKNYVNPTPKTN